MKVASLFSREIRFMGMLVTAIIFTLLSVSGFQKIAAVNSEPYLQLSVELFAQKNAKTCHYTLPEEMNRKVPIPPLTETDELPCLSPPLIADFTYSVVFYPCVPSPGRSLDELNLFYYDKRGEKSFCLSSGKLDDAFSKIMRKDDFDSQHAGITIMPLIYTVTAVLLWIIAVPISWFLKKEEEEEEKAVKKQ